MSADYFLPPTPNKELPNPQAKSTESAAYSQAGVDSGQIIIRGGSHLGISRANPTKDPKLMAATLETLAKLGVGMLVTIGGDDTAFSGSQVYLRAGGIHCPFGMKRALPVRPGPGRRSPAS